jgi:ComF family protein
MRTSTIGPTRRALHAAVSWVYPSSCPLCHRTLWRPEDREVCCDCLPDLRRIAPPFCSSCGTPFAVEPAHLCGECQTTPPPYRRLRAPFEYTGRLRKAILALKYHHEIGRAVDLAGLLLATESMGVAWPEYDLIVPIPLHDARIKARGYNQCALMVREIARRRKIVWSETAVKRVKNTKPQFGLSEPQRIENMRGAFQILEPAPFAGASVLLVDDIMATGSTINACAKAIKKAGATIVDAAVLSRSGTNEVTPEGP